MSEEESENERGAQGKRRRVLFVAYEFPPVGGAGVQRTTKFVKYLPQCGWDVSVLTVANPSVPVTDNTLLQDVPEDVSVVKARSWEPGYSMKAAVSGGGQNAGTQSNSLLARAKRSLKTIVRTTGLMVLQPDPQVLWFWNAVNAGKQLLRDTKHDAVFATGPPFSSFLIGKKLSQKFGLPLVVDYRDEWEISNQHRENRILPAPLLTVQRRMQRRVLDRASAAVATTEQSATAIRSLSESYGASTPVHCIYNGFDPADFEGVEDYRPSGERYRLVYVGTLWNLTDVSPLVEAAKRVCDQRPDLAGRLEFVFAGRRTPDQESVIDQLESSACQVTRLPYVTHDEAIKLMRESHELVLLLSGADEAGRVVPAKIFEYMAVKRPILSIAPQGEVTRMLAEHPAAFCCSPDDVAGLAQHLSDKLESFSRDNDDTDCVEFETTEFARPTQARQLASILTELSQ